MPSLFSRLPLPVGAVVLRPACHHPAILCCPRSDSFRETSPRRQRRPRAFERPHSGRHSGVVPRLAARSLSRLSVSPPGPPRVSRSRRPSAGSLHLRIFVFVVHTLYIRSLGTALFLCRRCPPRRPLIIIFSPPYPSSRLSSPPAPPAPFRTTCIRPVCLRPTCIPPRRGPARK